MTFEEECIKNECFKDKMSIKANEDCESNNHDIQSLSLKQFMKLMKRADSKVICLYSRKSFNRTLNRHQEKMLAILESIKSNDHENFMKRKSNYTIEELKKRIFEAYFNEIEIFRKEITNELVSHRKENHQINLISGSELSFVKNYRLMFEQKLKVVKRYLDHLEKNIYSFKFVQSSRICVIDRKTRRRTSILCELSNSERNYRQKSIFDFVD